MKVIADGIHVDARQANSARDDAVMDVLPDGDDPKDVREEPVVAAAIVLLTVAVVAILIPEARPAMIPTIIAAAAWIRSQVSPAEPS